MKKVIYCFSGTGNSLRAARVIADALKNTEIVNVRKDPSGYTAENADIVGFVCPVYEWDVPGRMREFISELSINPKAYIFMVATYIAVHGKAFETVEEILSSKGAHLSYARTVRCVASQCIAYPPFPPEKKQKTRVRRIKASAGLEFCPFVILFSFSSAWRSHGRNPHRRWEFQGKTAPPRARRN